MDCYLTYDDELRLIALTVIDRCGDIWAVVMDVEEYDRFAELVADDVEHAPSARLDLSVLRGLVRRATDRDPGF
jgi:hypothetical protein